MEVQSSQPEAGPPLAENFKVHRRNPKGLGLSTFRVRSVLIGGFLVLLFAVAFRLVAPAPAYAACTPPGAGWTCTESWTPIYGTCWTTPICHGFCSRAYCEAGVGLCSWCDGVCCQSGECWATSYSCITGWNYSCVCLPPAGCNGTRCPAGYDCISGRCEYYGDGEDGETGGCETDADCPQGYECSDGACSPVCQQAGSGDPCCPGTPGDCCDPNGQSNCCPGERCCWGEGSCYTVCCGGGGYSPDYPQGYITLSPRVYDPDSYQYYLNDRLGKDYQYNFTPLYWRPGEFGDWDSGAGCWFGNPHGEDGCRWKADGGYYDFRPGGAQYISNGGNFIVAWHGDAYVLSTNDDGCAGPGTSYRFSAPANWLVRAIEFDYFDNVDRGNFYISRYVRRTLCGHPSGEAVPATMGGDDGWIAKGSGHKLVFMQPASGEFWLVFRISPKSASDLWYGNWHMAYIYNVKLHLIKVDRTEKKTIDVISNVFEPDKGGQPFNIQRVRFSNESVSGDWSVWIPLDALPPDTKFGYGWELGNPTRTVWMEACTGAGLCAVFSDMIEYNPYGTVSGYIWNDLNNSNGTGRDPPSEPNYTASTVTVSYSCPSGSGSVDTSDGNYTFANVPAGSCSVSIGPLALGWSNTTLASVGVTVTAGGTTTANFGVWDNPEAWFQGCNGDAYGLGVSVPVPYDSKGSCDRWFLGADPNDTAGGVVISGNANLSCSGRCSERGLPPGWNAGSQAIDWPSSLSFSPPSGAINISTAFSFPISPQFTLQNGRSYIWDLGGVYSNKIHQNPTSQGYRVTGTGHRVAVIYVPASRTPFTIHPRFRAYKADGTPGDSDQQGVIFVVDGDVVINTGAVAQALSDDTPNLEAVIIASGKIEVYRGSDSQRRIVKGMLYGKGGINITGPWELKDNLYPVLKTIYNSLYFAPSNPLRQNAIKWREIVP